PERRDQRERPFLAAGKPRLTKGNPTVTIRSVDDVSRKAPKVTNLVLNRETLQELTESEAEMVGGGKPTKMPSYPLRISCVGFTCRPRCRISVDVACTANCTSSL